MTHILAFSKQVIMSFSCIILRRLLSSIRLVHELILLHISIASLEVAGLSALVIVALTPHIIVMVVLQSRIALICTETVKMLPFAETIVVVYCKLVFSCVNLVLVCNS